MDMHGKSSSSFRRFCSSLQTLFLCLPCFLLAVLAAPAESALIKFEYDAAGNMVSEQGKYYEYNDANQLVRVRKDSPDGEILAEYVYDYQGQRVKKVENGVTTYYIGKHYEERKGATVDEKTSYFFANSQRIAKSSQKNKASPQISYYLNNHLGSADVIIDEQGSQTDRLRYLPFGGYRTLPKERHTFTGKERDEVTDNYYFEARYYNYNIRRFTQADTIVPNLYDPQSLNRYAYALNNPAKYIDPTGHASCQCTQEGYVCDDGKQAVTYQQFLADTKGMTLSEVRKSIKNAPYRNVYDPKDGTFIDMQHFLIIGQYGSDFDPNLDRLANMYNMSGFISDIDNSKIGIAARKIFAGEEWENATVVSDIGLEVYQGIMGYGGSFLFKEAVITDAIGLSKNATPGLVTGNRRSAFSSSDIPSDAKGRNWYGSSPTETNWRTSFDTFFKGRY
ncbi:MAG: RHS repeat-associated core domain-containing protein [Candidatus Electrothrix sp. Rat3]|nr:RHS repeat-associated core domain-containing protein [Candidatus Electrothrix rattekaaiensis]